MLSRFLGRHQGRDQTAHELEVLRRHAEEALELLNEEIERVHSQAETSEG